MAIDDVTFEGSESFTTGGTPVDVKMNATTPQSAKQSVSPSPAAPAADPDAAKRAFQGKMFPQPPTSGGQPQSGAPESGVPREVRTTADAQAVIDKAFSNSKFKAAWADPNHPDHAALVQEMTQLFRVANPEEGEEGESQELNLLDGLRDREAFAGIHQPEMGPNLPGPFEPVDYAEFVEYVIQENIPPATAQNLMEDYATRLIASGGRGLIASDFTEMRAQFAGRLSPQVMDTLEKWITTEVYPRMRAQQGGR